MTFLDPKYLWALLSVLVPITIHLWSRKKVIVIKVGSIRFLESLNPKQTNSIKLNEIWLLILRMLILVLLSFLMAQPRIKGNSQHTAITYLVEPYLLTHSKIGALLDSLPENSVRSFQSGFPVLENADSGSGTHNTPNYWQLAYEMEDLPSDSMVVFTRGFQKGIKGMRPKIRANVRWVLFETDEPSDGVVEAAIDGDDISLLRVNGNHRHLAFEKEILSRNSDQLKIDSKNDSVEITLSAGQIILPLLKKESIGVHLFYEDSLSDQMKYLESAFRAIDKYLDKKIEIHSEKITGTIDSTDFEYLVWLSGKPTPKNSGRILLYRPDDLANELIVPAMVKNVFHLTRPLNSENIIKDHLAEQLIATLDLHLDLEEKILPFDRRTLALDELRPTKIVSPKKKEHFHLLDLSPWIWGLLAVLLIGERIISKYRGQ
ncbi:BatA domain-containing protein [Maribacter algicola]|uniref:BatA domain-containing protein n=1 Tax=Meishania litoralis TaxID=3434685 RepID=A0ACC7LIR3_9FLAO